MIIIIGAPGKEGFKTHGATYLDIKFVKFIDNKMWVCLYPYILKDSNKKIEMRPLPLDALEQSLGAKVEAEKWKKNLSEFIQKEKRTNKTNNDEAFEGINSIDPRHWVNKYTLISYNHQNLETVFNTQVDQKEKQNTYHLQEYGADS